MEMNTAFSRITVILWSLLVSPTITNGARILGIFPIPGKSQLLCNEAMMRSLYDAGHEITFASPFFDDESLKNYSVVNTRRNIPIQIGIRTIRESHEKIFFELVSEIIEVETQLCKDVLGSSEIQTLMKSKEKQFDVMFVTLIFMFPCYLPLAEKLNIPVIGTIAPRSSTIANIEIGNTKNPAVIPLEFNSFSDKMTFTERFENFWKVIFLHYVHYFDISRKLNEVYKLFYTPDLLDKKQISLVFANNHISLLSQATVPNVINVGGIHIKPAIPLPKNYQKFIDEAEHGVILFSFGSLLKTSSLDEDLIIAFRDAFAEIPQRVIWKFEEQIENISDNIMLMKWIPQRDILAHKNVKAFVSHCGMSGSYEGLTEGVPMVLSPLAADQMSNAALLERLGVGVLLDVYSATKQTVLEALNAIINDIRYRDTMKLVSKKFKDRPMSPQESIVYWTEYVIRHNGAPDMRPIGSDLLFYKYLLLDIIIAIIISTAISFFIVAKIIKKLHHLFYKSTNLLSTKFFIRKKT